MGEQALRFAKETNGLDEMIDANELLYRTYKEKGDIELSLKHHEDFTTLKDSIKKVKAEKEIISNDLRKELLLANEEQKLKLRQVLLKAVRERYLVVFLIAIFLIIVFFIVRRYYRSYSKEKKQLLNKIDLLNN